MGSVDDIEDDDPTRPAPLADRLEDEWASFARSLTRRGRSPATVKVYRKSFVNFWRWARDHDRPADPEAITRADINAWTDALLTYPKHRNGMVVMTTDAEGNPTPQLLTSSTRRILWQNLRPFFTWYTREIDAPNPYDRADPPGGDRPAPVPIVALEDIRKLLATCATRDRWDRRDAALIRVLIDCGPRRGELTAITANDWDRRSGMLRLTGKTGIRDVPASLSTAEAIDRWLRERDKLRHADLPWLWLGPKGRLGETGIAQALKRRCEMADIEPINPHRFRHTWAHLFRAEGGGEGDLMHLAGWSSTAMAQRYGSSAAAGRAQEAARRIAIGDKL